MADTQGSVKPPFPPLSGPSGPRDSSLCFIAWWLRYCGYEVEHVCNLTDIDDKIIRRMARDKISLQDLTDKYAQVSQHYRFRQIRTQGGGVGPCRRSSLHS